MKRNRRRPGTSISSRKSKARGQQKKIARLIAEAIGIPPEKVGYGDDCLIKPKRMGEAGVDVHISEQIRKRFPIACECKNTKSLGLTDAVKQAKEYMKAGYNHWLVCYRHKQKDLIIMDVDMFFKLYSKAYPEIEKDGEI